MSCEFYLCTDLAKFKCLTCNPQTSYCKNHSNSHLEILPFHNLKSLNKKLSKDQRELLLMRLGVFRNIVKKTRESIIIKLNSFIDTLMSNSKSVLTELHEIESNYNSIIDKLCNYDVNGELNLTQSDKIIIEILADEDKAAEEIELIQSKDLFITWLNLGNNPTERLMPEYRNINNPTTKFQELDKKVNHLKMINEDLSCELKNSQNKYDILKNLIGDEYFLKDLTKTNNKPPRLHYFKQNSKTFVTVKPLENSDEIFQMSTLANNLCHHGSSCYINNDELFWYGGYAGNVKMSWSYLINVKQKSGKQLASRNGIVYQGSCFYKGSIYVFGGVHQTACTREVEIFNFINWRLATHLPFDLHCITTAVIGNKICLVGYAATNFLVYDPDANAFNTPYNFTPNYHKILIRVEGITYLFENNKLHRIGVSSYCPSTILDNSTGVFNDWMIAPPIYHNKYFYFVFSTLDLYSYNLDTLKSRFIRKTGI